MIVQYQIDQWQSQLIDRSMCVRVCNVYKCLFEILKLLFKKNHIKNADVLCDHKT